ncbi:uncharacterized protein IWZ02DRAFT_438473 [Phyllosticta citriasiana]|uniref:uncharacterized protein n=1 Tax=Phyllosticta citriasiana TaxID=595635 RepID=UPI0030FD8C90
MTMMLLWLYHVSTNFLRIPFSWLASLAARLFCSDLHHSGRTNQVVAHATKSRGLAGRCEGTSYVAFSAGLDACVHMYIGDGDDDEKRGRRSIRQEATGQSRSRVVQEASTGAVSVPAWRNWEEIERLDEMPCHARRRRKQQQQQQHELSSDVHGRSTVSLLFICVCAGYEG